MYTGLLLNDLIRLQKKGEPVEGEREERDKMVYILINIILIVFNSHHVESLVLVHH